jgi:DNA-binding NtrC family response regulator
MMTEGSQERAILVLNRNDNDKDVRLITSLLEKVGLSVHYSPDANEALELFSSIGDSARLLIIDEKASPAAMPGFLECVRSLNPGIRILLIPESDEFDTAQSWIAQSNIRATLKKPFRRAKFLGSVLELIGEPLVRTA